MLDNSTSTFRRNQLLTPRRVYGFLFATVIMCAAALLPATAIAQAPTRRQTSMYRAITIPQDLKRPTLNDVGEVVATEYTLLPGEKYPRTYAVTYTAPEGLLELQYQDQEKSFASGSSPDGNYLFGRAYDSAGNLVAAVWHRASNEKWLFGAFDRIVAVNNQGHVLGQEFPVPVDDGSWSDTPNLGGQPLPNKVFRQLGPQSPREEFNQEGAPHPFYLDSNSNALVARMKISQPRGPAYYVDTTVWSVTDEKSPFPDSTIYSVSEGGVVAGSKNGAATIWKNGQAIPVQPEKRNQESAAVAINDSNQAIVAIKARQKGVFVTNWNILDIPNRRIAPLSRYFKPKPGQEIVTVGINNAGDLDIKLRDTRVSRSEYYTVILYRAR